MKKIFEPDAAYQPDTFAFKDPKKVKDILGRYPQTHQGRRSAVMPLLDLAQRQTAKEGLKADPPHGGWIPRAAMDEIARMLDLPPVKVYEVATFYSMFQLAPVGVHLIQVCTTTPCWLRGSDRILETCREKAGIDLDETRPDGKFTLVEVECLGACVNAPIVQINDDYYEDLTPELMEDILDALEKDKKPKTAKTAKIPGKTPESSPRRKPGSS